MRRIFSRSKYLFKPTRTKRLSQSYQRQAKSKRSYQYLHEQAVSLRRKVLLYLGLVIIIYLVYLLFYSDSFKIKYLNISGNTEISTAEIEELIWNSLERNSWFLFPQDNYFFLSKKRLQKDFQELNSLDEIEIEKVSPQVIDIKVTDRAGQFIWITNERIFLFDLKGQIFKEIAARELVNTGMPIVYDNSNSDLSINDKVLDQSVIELISKVFEQFEQLGLPIIQLDSFRVDSPEANFIKVVSKQGFEIHFNTVMPLEKQFFKLKRSLEEGKIDLNKIEYINLRIENQVIYK